MVLSLKGKDINTLITYQISTNKSISYKQKGLRYRDLSDVLKKEDRLKIELQGHCDERGDNNYNIALGQRRAESTKMYLIAQGVNPGRIHTVSYGEERPFCSDDEECRKTNRRVHIKFLE